MAVRKGRCPGSPVRSFGCAKDLRILVNDVGVDRGLGISGFETTFRAVASTKQLKPQGNDVLLLFPITSKAPEKGRFAVEIPEMEKRRAGLDGDMRLWLVLDEYNLDIIGRSYYLEPEPPLGRFSKAFFLPLMKEFIARRSQARGVARSS